MTKTVLRKRFFLPFSAPLTPLQIQEHFLNTTHRSATTAGGNVVITWATGTLQSAPSPSGPYSNVAGASSPYTNTVSGTMLFYRAQVQ
ncbi:MAG: hypothetical protein ABSH48_08930 [Verrucomicrobiota bacterium]|jgi:hypothetical protein